LLCKAKKKEIKKKSKSEYKTSCKDVYVMCLKDAGAGHPHVPKNELMGKMTGVAELRALSESQEKTQNL